MARTIKLTFTVDQRTADRIDTTARRLGIPKSGVIREAVAEYAARAGRLSERERLRMLKAMDDLMARPPTRPQADVDRELAAHRRSRRRAGRRTPVE
jgi:Ribbon-helix-helix protein, copG family